MRKVGPRSSGVYSCCVWCRYHAHCTLTYGLGCYADGEDAYAMRMTFDPAVFETMNDTSKKIEDDVEKLFEL